MDSKTNHTEVSVLEEGGPNERDVSFSDPARLFGNDITTGQHYFEMVNNINIQEEVDISDTHLTNGRDLYSMDREGRYKNGITIRNDFERNNIHIKEEVDVSTDLPNENVIFSTSFGNRLRSDSLACGSNFELDSNTKLKEPEFNLDIDIKKEGNCFSSDLVRKVKKELNVYNENGEVSVERTATEIGSQVETSVSNFFRQNKNRDENAEASESAESSGFSVDATPGGEIMETSQMSQNAYSLRSKKFESVKNCDPALYSERQVQSSDSGLQQNSSRFNLPPEDKRVHKCGICKNSFTCLSDLKTHTLTHEDKKFFECDVCKIRFTQLVNLKKHEMIHWEKPYDCNVCKESFMVLSDFRAHIRAHTCKKLLECKFCKKTFTSLSVLKTHTMRHEGKKLYECDVCKKGFVLLTDLKRHEMLHWEKPYECNVCQKSFMVLSGFRAHIRIHTGKKLLECNICNKTFECPSHLKIHIMTHEGIKPHQCSICKKSFTQLSGLRAHNLIHKYKQQEEV